MYKRASYKFAIIIMMMVFLFIAANSVAAKDASSTLSISWQAEYLQDHVLTGGIWDTHKQAWISEKQFQYALNHYDYILLGEVHTHPDHHVLQAKAIDAMVSAGRKPSIVMEMLSQSSWKDQPQKWHKQSELQELANMLNDAWPWELYAPILSSVVRHQLNLYAGNISSEKLHAWSSQQASENIKQTYKRYAYDETNFANLENSIIDSHCGYANDDHINFMSRAQMQRDRVITESLLEIELPVVLIAGSGHVRNDYAVPMQLRRQHNQISYLSVVYLPVQEGLEHPQDYAQVREQLYDVIYFTPSHTLEDPCEKFRKQLKNMQQKHTSEHN